MQKFMAYNKPCAFEFLFVVESTTRIGEPLVYKGSHDFIKGGGYGDHNEDKICFSEINFKKGVYELMKEYDFYEKTEWKEDIIIAKNENKETKTIVLNWDGTLSKSD